LPEQTADLQSILRAIPGLANAEVVQPLNGGETSDKWLLESGGQRLVLRVDRPAAALLGLDRRAEAEILKVVGEADIGPRLLWTDPANGIQLCNFIEGTPWTLDDTRDPARLAGLARTLARLHRLPPAGERFDPAGAAARYAAGLATTQSDELAAQVAALVAELDSASRHAVLCHNDPVHANIIGRGPVRLIDWEYAAVGDRCFDLAVMIRHHELSPALAARFVAEYGREARPVSRQRLDAFCRLYDLLAALWYLSLIRTAGPDSPFQAEWDRISLRLNESRPVGGFP
jgi:thiamine kinase